MVLLPAVFVWHPHVQAQFPSFPDSNAMWRTDIFIESTYEWSYYYHMRQTDNDTLINGEWYSAIHEGMEGQGGAFAGGIREDAEGLVHYYHANTDSTFLLYDFDPSVGDSLEVWVGHHSGSFVWTHWMHVLSIDTFNNTNGTPYKQIGVTGISPSEFGGQVAMDWWIEGVGGTEGLLTTSALITLSADEELGCMVANDTLWPGGNAGPCGAPNAIAELGMAPPVAHPNPSNRLFTLSTASNLTDQVLVYDPHGREVLRTREKTIDLGAHPPGVYTAVVTTAQGRQAVRLVLLR